MLFDVFRGVEPVWKEKRPLLALADWVNGYPLKPSEVCNSGLPVIKIAELRNGLTGATEYTRIDIPAANRVSRGSMCFSWSGNPKTSIGAFVWDGPDGLLNQHIFLVHPAEGVARTFLLHLLNYLQPSFALIASGKQSTGLGHVTKADLKEIIIGVPTLPEQRRIAAVLDMWDDAIAIAEALAELKRSRFAGLMQALINRANGRKEELINFASLEGSKCDVDGGEFDDSIELDNVASGSGQLLGRSSADGLSGQRVRFQAGDTLFAKLRPYLRKSFFADEAGMASTEMWILRADEARCLPRYLNYLVRSSLFQAEADRPTGSRMPRADWSWVQETPLPLPGLNKQGSIVLILEAAEADWRLSVDAVSALRRQKRGLMQKLLTGEWRVPATGDAFAPGGPAADRLKAAE